MSGRTGELQTTLNAECVERMPKKMPEPAVEPQHLVAPKRSYRPYILTPSAIGRICHLPPERYRAKTQAKLMYINSRFGKCSPTVCHEDICPYTEVCVCKKPKKLPKPSVAMIMHINRIVKKSRNSAKPKSHLNGQISENATRTRAGTPGV